MEAPTAEQEQEEAALENELESQLAEHKSSLEAVREALGADPGCEDLLEAKQALEEAVSVAEEGLLQLKRNRLLREIESMTTEQHQNTPVPASIEGSAPNKEEQSFSDMNEIKARGASGSSLGDGFRASPASSDIAGFSVGSKCRFRHTDGRWYAGLVVGTEDDCESGLLLRKEEDKKLRITFLHPTTDSMQMCMFFLQGNCRFGARCRKSHGFLIGASAVKLHQSLAVGSLPLGSAVLVKTSESPQWQQAELVCANEDRSACTVALIVDGSKHEVSFADVAPIEGPAKGKLTQGCGTFDSLVQSDSDESESSLEDENGLDLQDVGEPVSFVSFSQDFKKLHTSEGNQGDTVRIAEWEQHTRGVASKMMFAMGYRAGEGLGKHGQGRPEPLELKVLPAGRSLDFIHEGAKVVGKTGGALFDESGRKKKRRGGERSRRKKQQAELEAHKAEQEKVDSGDLFGFINRTLASSGDVAEMLQSNSSSQLLDARNVESQPSGQWASDKKQGKTKQTQTTPSRQALLVQDKMINEAQGKVARLEEMAERNKKDKAMHGAVLKRLELARGELKAVQGSRKKHEHAIKSAESMRRWVKF